ncbi:hypothetical protein NLJ89_g11182 [Agrocybe chaxingu]|uniref:GBD/FH3 domain-containing protein n=1 Tax=Agrocybe chaxingu TaxID=84603 RepID=A0A9W8JMC8_9AGAR|nr:hypothetical protein NLJ89_g11182 [Agrocybe chaxingu]
MVEELGLAKSLPIPGAGNLEYVVEEVWVDGDSERSSRLPGTTPMFNVVEFPFSPNPFKSTARRHYRFCVPDEWYRRSKSRSVPSAPGPSECTIRRLAALQESEDEDEDEGTAKIGEKRPSQSDTDKTIEQRGLVTQGRLSTMFEGWLRSTPPTSPNRNSAILSPENRKSVSEPKLVEKPSRNSFSKASASDSSEDENEDDFTASFEEMMDDLGLKGDKRTAMRELTIDRKKYLLRQNRDFKSASRRVSTSSQAYSATYGPSSAAALLPKLVPQLTGDAGLIRRLSMVGWGAASSTSSTHADVADALKQDASTPSSPRIAESRSSEELQLLQPQTTGSLWSSWWTSAGGDKTSGSDKPGFKEAPKSAKWYIDGLRPGKPADMKLVKHLITLRVHLSTANLAFIQEFIGLESGLNALGTLLASLVGKGGKRKTLSEVESAALLEVIKCLRVLLNTEAGFNTVVVSPTVITHISYALHASSLKVHTLASELLAAICILSVTDGHKAVLGALSDFRVAYDENFRFETLLSPLRLPEFTIDGDVDNDNAIGFRNEEDGIWEVRIATMALINAITNCPENLEDRMLLREEFSRRGLNELIVALRYIKPPDSLLTQLNLYTEEKFEDEEDMRERARALMPQAKQTQERPRSESEASLQDLIQLARQHGELYPTMVDILRHYGQILQRDVGIQLKADLFVILDRFVEQAAMLDSFDDSWRIFLKRFASSVRHITGQDLEVKASHESDSREIVEQELETLRFKVEQLSDERTELRNELNQQIAEINTLKSISSGIPVPNVNNARKAGSEQNFHGLVQRLVQKEKQVLQLQTELDRYKAQNPSDGREDDERAKRERDRIKWNTLMEEITKYKTKIGELENLISIKDKEIVYLKRALESVYTRFMLREDHHDGVKAAEMDAQLIASRTIERLTEKDLQIVSLNKEISEVPTSTAAYHT